MELMDLKQKEKKTKKIMITFKKSLSFMLRLKVIKYPFVALFLRHA